MIDRAPCLDPTKTSSRSSFFVTELDRAEVCKDDYDLRYNLVGDEISEFELQEQNGIIEKLQGLSYHERYVDYGQKTLETLRLWARPTIMWELS